MSPQAMKLLSEGLAHNTRLTDLFFSANNLQEGGEGGLALIRSLSNKKDLKSLALNSCNINGAYLEELKMAIQGHQELKELYLFANRIKEDEAKHVSAIIKNKAKLTSLGLSNNRLQSSGAQEIA